MNIGGSVGESSVTLDVLNSSSHWLDTILVADWLQSGMICDFDKGNLIGREALTCIISYYLH